ncbi:UNVERIFIED_CONTAM: hypothetical protein HDU68_007960 [Siphonaria sp. JEL0065]|nr:hypothetical protein HDU68_007960 [Siphonaria sp. JEL0065]
MSVHSLRKGASNNSLSEIQSRGFSGHTSKVSIVLSGLVTETRVLMKLVGTVDVMGPGNEQQQKTTREPLIKQVDCVLAIIDDLSQVIPNYASEISPLISDINKSVNPPSKRTSFRISTKVEKTFHPKVAIGALFFKLRDALRELAVDSKVAKEMDIEQLDVLIDEIGWRETNILDPPTLPSKSSSLLPSPTSRTELQPKTPGVIKRVLSMITRPKSAIEPSRAKESQEDLKRPSNLARSKSAHNQSNKSINLTSGVSVSLSRSSSQSNASLEPPEYDMATLEKHKQKENDTKMNPLSKSLSRSVVSLKGRGRSVSLKASEEDQGNSWLPPTPSPVMSKKDPNDSGDSPENDTMDMKELEAIRARPIVRSKSLVPTDKDVLLLQNQPSLPNNNNKSRFASRKSLVASKQSLAPALPSPSASTQNLAAALFGDPNLPIADMPAFNAKENIRKFGMTDSAHTAKIEVNMSNNQMRFSMQSSKKKIFDVDLSKWETESNIKLHDLREDYKRTEIMEILKNPKNPNLYSVCAHTVMYSNLLPLGTIIIESENKITVHVESRGALNAKPLFSITGEINNGRFTIIGRSKASREQKAVGSSSGWVTKKKLKLAQSEYCECNVEIDEAVLNDVLNYDRSNDEINSLQSQLKEIKTNSVTRFSQLLMAGIVLGLAPKE